MAIIDCLEKAALFADLSQAELEQIAADCHTRRYEAGEIIFYQGDPGHSLYLVESGQVRIFVNGIEGQETSVILIGRPGQIFGELAVIDGLPRSATAVAILDTLVYTLDRDRFREYMRRSPQLALNFMRTLSMKVRYNTRQVDSLASLDVAKRLARKLLELGQDYGTVGDWGVQINTALTQSDLASLIGATRESTNKVLRLFRNQGLISNKNGHLVILDAEALKAQVTTH